MFGKFGLFFLIILLYGRTVNNLIVFLYQHKYHVMSQLYLERQGYVDITQQFVQLVIVKIPCSRIIQLQNK